MLKFIDTVVPNQLRTLVMRQLQLPGSIDVITDGHVRGWAKLDRHNEPIRVDLLINGRIVAADQPAAIFRGDLRDAGIGDGGHGFSIAVPPEYLRADVLELAIRPSGTERPVLMMRMSRHHESGEFHPSPNTVRSPRITINVDILNSRLLQGWCVDRANKGRIFDLDILINGEFFASIRNDRQRRDLKELGISDGFGGFFLRLPLFWLDAGAHTVTLRTPDGRETQRRVNVPERSPYVDLHRTAQPVRDLSIIVPVHNAASDLTACIQRLAAWTPDTVNVLFIDDASMDPRITDLLQQAARAYPNMRFLRNAANVGFTRTVNRGFAETGTDDVIILNSDARVTPGWIEGMTMAARSAPRVATVTPMSDRAGVFSAPRIGNNNELPDGVDEVTYARAFRRHSLGLYPAVPTGNGFCMFIRRSCLDEVGNFDADAFPRGYGEENDFCMRAMRMGWRHILDDRTYIFHARSKSFGEARHDLMRVGRSVIDERYPDYGIAIRVFTISETIRLARMRARAALADCASHPRTPIRIVFVISTQSGGTPQTNHDLMTGLAEDADCWLLRCDSTMLELSRMVGDSTEEVIVHHLDEFVDPISHRSHEYDSVISQWLLGIDPDIVHIRHLGWHSLSLPKIVKNIGKKSLFSFHDFYTICPSVKLLDNAMQFCGGTCTPGTGHCRVELWPENALPELKHNWVYVWRQRFAEALAPCDAFITTSPSARTRILEHLPSVPSDRFHVIPHGRDFSAFRQLSKAPVRGERLRILLPGTINRAKGLDVICRLLEYDEAESLEFHILGEVIHESDETINTHRRIFCHGRYDRDGFAERAARIRAHIGAVFSIWDETYCHTLTELWSIGMPVAVLDFPTLAARVRQSGAGWVLNHDDIGLLYQEILRVGFDEDERNKVTAALVEWQDKEASVNTVANMAASYKELYHEILRD